MRKMAIFLDTGVLAAFHNIKDPNYLSAKNLLWRVSRGEYGKAFTSEYVVDEGTTLIFARTKNRPLSNAFLQHCLNAVAEGSLGFLFVNADDFQATASEYGLHDELSFTDCSIVVLMRKHGIKHIATFDKAFRNVKGLSVVSDSLANV